MASNSGDTGGDDAAKRSQEKGEVMTRVLLLGYDPETVDFSDPALPPGMTAEKVHAGIAVAMKQFAERGWEADVSLIRIWPGVSTGASNWCTSKLCLGSRT